MCVASLTLIFTKSVGTLQPTRPLGRVGSKFNWPSEDQCQRSHSKWVFVFIPHLECKYSHLILSKLSRKSTICPRRSPWLRIVLVRSLRSMRLDTAWLVKNMTYFDLIAKIGGCFREFQRSKYKFSSHPGTHGQVWGNMLGHLHAQWCPTMFFDKVEDVRVEFGKISAELLKFSK